MINIILEKIADMLFFLADKISPIRREILILKKQTRKKISHRQLKMPLKMKELVLKQRLVMGDLKFKISKRRKLHRKNN